MFCPECGYKNNDENKFCLQCGKELMQKSKTVSNDIANINQNAAPNIQTTEKNNYNSNHTYPNNSIDMCTYTKGARTIRACVHRRLRSECR